MGFGIDMVSISVDTVYDIYIDPFATVKTTVSLYRGRTFIVNLLLSELHVTYETQSYVNSESTL